MKRMHSVRFFAALLTGALFLSACSSPSGNETKTAAPTEIPVTETATEPFVPQKPEPVIPTVPKPFDRAELDAIPVANSGMTEAELREICVRYMLLEKQVVWTPDGNLKYECSYAGAADAAGMLTVPAGALYRGMPYTGAALDLECFLDLYDEKTGVLNVAKYGLNVGNFVGNTCSTSTFWAWARVSPKVYLRSVSHINAANGYTPLGPVRYDLTIDAFSQGYDTTDIVPQNGEQTMFQCYALLKPASGLVTFRTGTTGHVRMAIENAVVVKNADGTINGEKSSVKCAEQTSSRKDEDAGENGTVQAYCYAGRTYSFNELYKANYIAFEIPEFAGKGTVEKASVSLKTDGEGLDALLKGTITSNYAISRVDAAIRDENGEEAYRNYSFGYAYQDRARNMMVQRLLQKALLNRHLKKGADYSVVFSVRLGNGETVLLDPVPFTY